MVYLDGLFLSKEWSQEEKTLLKFENVSKIYQGGKKL